MKTSDLIKSLTDSLALNGDLPVGIYEPNPNERIVAVDPKLHGPRTAARSGGAFDDDDALGTRFMLIL